MVSTNSTKRATVARRAVRHHSATWRRPHERPAGPAHSGPAWRGTAPWLAGLIEALEQRPVCNPRRIHPGADPDHCRPADVLCDPFAFLIRLRSPNGEGVPAFGFEVGNVERGGFRHPEHGVTHDGDDRGVPKAFDGPSIVGRCGCCGIGLFPADPGHLTPAPVGSLAPETSKDALGGRTNGRRLARQFHLEPDGGGDHAGNGWGAARLVQAGEVRGQGRIVQAAAGEPSIEAAQGSGVGAAGVLAD